MRRNGTLCGDDDDIWEGKQIPSQKKYLRMRLQKYSVFTCIRLLPVTIIKYQRLETLKERGFIWLLVLEGESPSDMVSAITRSWLMDSVMVEAREREIQLWKKETREDGRQYQQHFYQAPLKDHLLLTSSHWRLSSSNMNPLCRSKPHAKADTTPWANLTFPLSVTLLFFLTKKKKRCIISQGRGLHLPS